MEVDASSRIEVKVQMAIWSSLFMIFALILVVFLGVEVGGAQLIFGTIIPYLAFAIFLVGFIYKVVRWATAPVPFRIPLTGGQQKTLLWIKDNKLDNPSSTGGVIGRMALEILLFRSLFRNVKSELHENGNLSYHWEKWLWLFGLMLHWSFLLIVVRHLRFFTEPVPALIGWVEGLDGLFRFSFQAFYLTDVFIVAAVTFLFLRRVAIPKIKYISMVSDYFPLMLIGSIAITGILMKHVTMVDVAAIKGLAMGLVTFKPAIPEGIGIMFYIHLFLVNVLLAYFPFSKLMHAGGVFMSPTRNAANDSRRVRHINPWNYPVDVHTYEEYEDEFREKMVAVGISVEKG